MPLKSSLSKKDFTFVYQTILRDSRLCAFDRGILITLINLPNNWAFSINGLCSILPDGKSAITNSLHRLESNGYIHLNRMRNANGQFETKLDFFVLKKTDVKHPGITVRNNQTVADNPSPSTLSRSSTPDNQPQYKNNKKEDINKHKNPSILLSLSNEDGSKDRANAKEEELSAYRKMIAENIHLDWLLDAAKRSKNPAETDMVNEIYTLICDYVCFPHGKIKIKDAIYPWLTVKKQFLELKYTHVASVLNRVVDSSLEIKNMQQYLISMLYSESLCGTIKEQADLHDDYLMYLRGTPYAV